VTIGLPQLGEEKAVCECCRRLKTCGVYRLKSGLLAKVCKQCTEER